MTTQPSRRDRTRPLVMLGFAGVVAVFVAVVAALASRDLMIGLIALGVTFIVTLVTLATITLTMGASAEERLDLDEQDRREGH